MLNLSQRRAFDRQGAASIEREIDKAKAELDAAAKAAAAEYLAAAAAREAARPKFTRADLEGATHARDQYGWGRIIRLNAKTVTLNGMFGPDRVPYARILDHRTITEDQ